MQEFSSNLDSMVKCPVCTKKYGKRDSLVLESTQRRSILHFTCKSCQMASLMFFSQQQDKIIGMGVLTDLSRLEIDKILNQEVVSANQILAVYNFFKNNK